MPIALVQEIDQVAISETLHSQVVLTVPEAGVQAGNSILVAVASLTWEASEIQATDSAGNLYVTDFEEGIEGAADPRTAVLSAHDVLPLEAGDEITITWFASGQATYNAAVAIEVSGLTGVVDQAVTDYDFSTTPNSGSTAPTPSAAAFAFGVIGAGIGVGTFTPGAGWTSLTGASSYVEEAAGHTLFPLYRVLPAATTVEADGTLSLSRAWTAGVVTYTGDTITMADPVGNLGHVAIGVEATAGTGVDAQVYLDAISESIKGEGGPIRSKALTGGRMVKKAVMGPYNWRGDIQYEVTPDKCTKLLYAALGSLAAAPETATPYTHVFKTGSSLKPLSVHVYRPGPDAVPEPCHFVYPGGYVESLEFSQNAEEILTATVSLQGRAEEVVYDAPQADGGIAYSLNDPFVFHELAVSIGGSPVTITNDWKFRINTGVTVRRNLSAGRAANRAFAGDSMISGSFVLVFEDISEHRKWLGDTADTSPVNVGTTVTKQALQLAWTKTADLKLTLKCGSAYYRASGPAIQGRDQVILQPIEWEALYNSSDQSDIVVTVINGETNANIANASSTITP